MNSQGPATHGDLLRRYRLAAGLSQEELAERAGLSVTSISGIERGGPHRPRKDTVRLLAEALGLSAAERSTLEALTRRSVPAAGLARPAAIPTNLPVPPTALVGREREVASVCALLRRPEVRLLTLTGPGGVGKTHLSMQVAEHLRGSFPDGVFFVDLAPVRDPALVVSTIAQVVGVQEAGDRPLRENLIASLQGRQVLLVLDNCEHLLPAAPAVADMLARCRGLTVLSTSRARLHVRGEREVVVPPLRQEMALELFVQRAQAVKADFELAAADASTVAAICARLDGLPLAIELAAAHIKVFPPRALLARLEQRLPVLIGGPRDVPEHHQTLRSTIAWSYDLLDPGEQALFRRLAVFAGGCTPEAAEVVCPVTDDLRGTVLDVLVVLVDKSLMYQGAQGDAEPRFRMLETIREYALERLAACGEREEVGRRHTAYYLAFAEAVEPHLRGPHDRTWLDRLEDEHDNLRIALHWGMRPDGEALTSLRLAGALARFWVIRGHLSEGRAWLEKVLSQGRVGAADVGVRAKALTGAGLLVYRQGDYAQARVLHEESLTLYRYLEDQTGIAAALSHLGSVAYKQGDYARACALHEESLALRRELGDKVAISASLTNLGIAASHQGDYERAWALLDEGLRLRRELGSAWDIAVSLSNLGTVAYRQGHYEQARALTEESLALRQGLGDKGGIATSLHTLANVASKQGQGEQSRILLGQSLQLAYSVGDQSLVAECLESVAMMAVMASDVQHAVRLAGAATTLRESIGAPLLPAARVSIDATLAAARITLGNDIFAATWSAGQLMRLEQAVEEGLEGLSPLGQPNETR